MRRLVLAGHWSEREWGGGAELSSYDVRQDKYIETGMNFVTTVTRRIVENLEGQGRFSMYR